MVETEIHEDLSDRGGMWWIYSAINKATGNTVLLGMMFHVMYRTQRFRDYSLEYPRYPLSYTEHISLGHSTPHFTISDGNDKNHHEFLSTAI